MDVPRLQNPKSIRELDPLSAQALHQLVNHNPHPIARALREVLLAEHPALTRKITDNSTHEEVGKGVSWHDPGANEWALGKSGWKSPANLTHHTVLSQNGLPVTGFDFHEDVRDDACDAVNFLCNQNLDTAILSGDAEERVSSIARQLGLAKHQTRAGCSPREKANWIQTHAKNCALMIGDGANDSLAFDAAICRGTPVVDKSILEASADFFFFGRSLRCLPELFLTAQRRRQTVATIFATAVIYNLAAVSLCLAGMMHPLLAAILMPLSSVATLAIAWAGLSRTSSSS